MARVANREIEPTALGMLLFRCAQGDHVAFEDLFNATKPKLFGTALLIVKRRDLAEEVVQEAYVRIWTKAYTYESSLGSPIAWMATIARNLAINMIRRPLFEIQADECALIEVPADSPSVLEEIELLQDQSHALNALGNLDAMSQRLIIAAYLHGESREALSARFGIPVNTVKTWIRRGLLATRACLADADGLHRTVA
jgi:RNA polymerase sigma-70 factor (ECF subfamily)